MSPQRIIFLESEEEVPHEVACEVNREVGAAGFSVGFSDSAKRGRLAYSFALDEEVSGDDKLSAISSQLIEKLREKGYVATVRELPLQK